jgi:hypothetical protein
VRGVEVFSEQVGCRRGECPDVCVDTDLGSARGAVKDVPEEPSEES